MTSKLPKAVCGICKVPMLMDTLGAGIAVISDGHPPRVIYKTAADKYTCPSCGISVITGFGGSIIPEDGLEFDQFQTSINVFPQSHAITFDEIESTLSELRMLVYGLEMKRDNLTAYDDSQRRRKKRK